MMGVALHLAGCGADVGGGVVANHGQTLCYSDYVNCINPIFNTPLKNQASQTVQCASGGCHEVGGGFAGSLKIYPNISSSTVDPDELSRLQANFLSSMANTELAAPADSKLLVKPLAGNGGINGSHTGNDLFPGTGDPCYTAILSWISKSVADQSDPACGSCSLPTLANCGYP